MIGESATFAYLVIRIGNIIIARENMEYFYNSIDQKNQKLLLNTKDEIEDMDEYEDDDDKEDEEYVVLSLACEDCDYRWEVTVEDEEDQIEEIQYCPMCGSSNTTQI